MTRNKQAPTWDKSFKALRVAIEEASKMSKICEKRDEAAGDLLDESSDAYYFESELRGVLDRFSHRSGE